MKVRILKWDDQYLPIAEREAAFSVDNALPQTVVEIDETLAAFFVVVRDNNLKMQEILDGLCEDRPMTIGLEP